MLKKINLPCPALFNEPMGRHTSFRVGGPADIFLTPRNLEELTGAFVFLNRERIPTFILGAGANILVSDRGIRGAVIDLGGIRGCTLEKTGTEVLLSAAAGTPISEASSLALEHGFGGLEFIYSMPGSVGGSVWMNARCYGRSVSDVLAAVECLDREGKTVRIEAEPQRFGYKRSPFQDSRLLIVQAAFRLVEGDRTELWKRMQSIERDRASKGHFLYPSAGSVFKNNRSFGEPTGKLIDSLGLKGMRIGDAVVSERHGNIIVNAGRARAQEVLELIRFLEARIREAYGFELEREVLLVGDWREEGR